MRKITLVCVGNLKEKFWVNAIEEYKKRLSRFFDFKIVELPETRIVDKINNSTIQKALTQEAQKMLPILNNKTVVPKPSNN